MTGDQMTTAPETAFDTAVRAHRLDYQHCLDCGNDWLPPLEECPRCWSADVEWRPASGGATIVSWVRYHVAFRPEDKDRVPYAVAVAQLDEGPRVVGVLADEPARTWTVGGRLRFAFEDRADQTVLVFRADDAGQPDAADA